MDGSELADAICDLAARWGLRRARGVADDATFSRHHLARTIGAWWDIKTYRRMLAMLQADRSFLDFHEGRSNVLPGFYWREFDRLLGPFAALLTEADRTPELEQDCPMQVVGAKVLRPSGKLAAQRARPAVAAAAPSVIGAAGR